VHIEPRHDVAVRYRLDGLLTAITELPKWMDAASCRRSTRSACRNPSWTRFKGCYGIITV
jgi:type II secretory ATPase GspE/PulE/Tfp pilus assembly ATPase PilB-like protein